MAYELVQDFQYINDKKQILTLPKGTKVENEKDGYFIFKVRGKTLSLETDLVVNNPEFFKKTDWVIDLAEILKKNKKATSPRLAKIVGEFFTDSVMKGQTLVSEQLLHTMLEACRIQYYSLKDESFLEPIKKLGWSYNERGVYPPTSK